MIRKRVLASFIKVLLIKKEYTIDAFVFTRCYCSYIVNIKTKLKLLLSGTYTFESNKYNNYSKYYAFVFYSLFPTLL